MNPVHPVHPCSTPLTPRERREVDAVERSRRQRRPVPPRDPSLLKHTTHGATGQRREPAPCRCSATLPRHLDDVGVRTKRSSHSTVKGAETTQVRVGVEPLAKRLALACVEVMVVNIPATQHESDPPIVMRPSQSQWCSHGWERYRAAGVEVLCACAEDHAGQRREAVSCIDGVGGSLNAVTDYGDGAAAIRGAGSDLVAERRHRDEDVLQAVPSDDVSEHQG